MPCRGANGRFKRCTRSAGLSGWPSGEDCDRIRRLALKYDSEAGVITRTRDMSLERNRRSALVLLQRAERLWQEYMTRCQ